MLIALSGYGQNEHIEKATESGFDHYLTKPISILSLESYFTSLENKSVSVKNV